MAKLEVRIEGTHTVVDIGGPVLDTFRQLAAERLDQQLDAVQAARERIANADPGVMTRQATQQLLDTIDAARELAQALVYIPLPEPAPYVPPADEPPPEG